MRPLFLAVIAALALPATPVLAQKNERVLLVFGEDKCPKSEDPEEIVVCARSPENERYRIPEKLRGPQIGPAAANESWAVRAESLEYIGRGGINSCSTIGPGGWTGCYQEMLRIASAEKREAARNRRAIDGED